MMPNSLNPASYSYVVSAEARPAYHQFKCVESFENTNALNQKQSNGRINAGGGDYYTAVSVSPFHPLFHSQIEKGISGIVYALLDKNYLTMASCEGHDGTPPFVKIALASLSDATDILKCLNSIPYVTCKLHKTCANTEVYLENGLLRVRHLDPAKFSKIKETDAINKLFFRNHASYCFLDIILYEHNLEWWNIVGQLKMKYHKFTKLKNVKQNIVDIINSEIFPIYYK